MFFLRSRVIRTARLKLVVSFLAAFIFEAVAIWLYLRRADSPYLLYGVLAAHTLSALSFILITSAKPRALPGLAFYYPRIAALFTFFMPVIGLCGITLTLLMARVFMRSHGLAEEYREKAYVGQGIDVDLPKDITEFLYDEVDVHPIADILAGDDMGMKRGAVNLLRRIGSAEAVRLLRKSLSDVNAEVRFYAHTALTRLEEDYAESLDKARFRVQRYDSAQAHAELAITYRNYARSGLPERNMQEQALGLACEHWRTAVQKAPDNADFNMRLAEVCCESRQYREALELYQKSIVVPELELESRLGMCRIFFEMGNYISLYEQVLLMQSRPVPPASDPFKLSTYNFWIEYFSEPETEDDADNISEDFDLSGVIT
ncbi:HEAT repeat domain-containing protein [Maridesulfovibrio sp. FT414]|uniref:HEAT repeat domain-containing protein n=1 Tax=Maridesulfovibrio sp. FT414 TaxID=2979469 RepID=UPI003D800F0D